MSEQLAHGIDVRSQIQHHYGECVAAAVERDFFVYACPQYPVLYGLVGAVGREYVREDIILILATLSHNAGRLFRDVEIFLPFGFLLPKDDAGKIPLPEHVAPFEPQDVAASQSCQAGEQERPPDTVIVARCVHEPFQFFECQVHSCSFFCLKPVNATTGIDSHYTIIERLVQASPQFIEIANL